MGFKMKVSDKDYVSTEHGPIYNFFYSFWTHILQVMSVNVLLLIFNIPSMILAYFVSMFFLPRINSSFELDNFIQLMLDNGIIGNDTINNDISGEDAAVQLYFLLIVFCVIFLISSTLICIGPFQAGFSQIYRNLRRQSGVYFFPDFKEGIISNWKQSLAASVISCVVTCLDLFAVSFYLNSGTKFGAFIAAFFIAFFFVFMLIQNIVYQIMVSRDLPLTKIYRNAFLFFLMEFGPCLGMIGMMAVFLIVIPFMLILNTSYQTLGIFVFLYGFIMIAFVQYLLAFFTGGLLHKFMPASKAPAEEDDDTEEVNTEQDEDG
ncbi:hypothetical protein SAMN02910456_00959 [Ruminococcaceae bacterium YRB3002]|nr:hypothetical protein SAMN02910456_00959 [Ruminococcaceae bacterium YRB3002]